MDLFIQDNRIPDSNDSDGLRFFSFSPLDKTYVLSYVKYSSQGKRHAHTHGQPGTPGKMLKNYSQQV